MNCNFNKNKISSGYKLFETKFNLKKRVWSSSPETGCISGRWWWAIMNRAEAVPVSSSIKILGRAVARNRGSKSWKRENRSSRPFWTEESARRSPWLARGHASGQTRPRSNNEYQGLTIFAYRRSRSCITLQFRLCNLFEGGKKRECIQSIASGWFTHVETAIQFRKRLCDWVYVQWWCNFIETR